MMPLQTCQLGGKSGWRWGQQGKCYTGSQGRAKALRQARAIKANVANAHAPRPTRRRNPLRADPTRTTTIRRLFEEEIRRRFARVKRAVRALVVVEDAFGLRGSKFLKPFIGNIALNTRWRFNTTSQQTSLFNTWIVGQMGTQVTDLSVVEQDRYWQRYVDDGYKKGAGRAFDDTRKPALASSKAQLDFYKGTKAEFLRSSFARAESVDKVKLLAGRVFTELEGVNADMATRMTRSLADGLVTGSNPVAIARQMNLDLDIGLHRAERIARTEIIRAHAEGQLDAMRQLGVKEIGVMVEWSTAGDDRVCPRCSPMEGVVLKIEEGSGLIPRHPNCRCAFTPANVGESTKGQIRGKSKVEGAFRRSVKAEIPKRAKRSIEVQKRLSKWLGARQKIGKKRLTPLVPPTVKKVVPPRPVVKPDTTIKTKSEVKPGVTRGVIYDCSTGITDNVGVANVKRKCPATPAFKELKDSFVTKTSEKTHAKYEKAVITHISKSRKELENLGPKARKAIHRYTKNAKGFNTAVRTGKGSANVELINDAIEKFGKPNPKAPLFRGMKFNNRKDREKFVKNMTSAVNNGKLIEFDGIVSTSETQGTAVSFGSYLENKGVLFRIKSAKGLRVSSVSDHSREMEVILRHKSKYAVQRVKEVEFVEKQIDALITDKATGKLVTGVREYKNRTIVIDLVEIE